MPAYLSQTSLQVFVEPSSTTTTSKSFSSCRVRLSISSSTSSGRLNTGIINEYNILRLSFLCGKDTHFFSNAKLFPTLFFHVREKSRKRALASYLFWRMNSEGVSSVTFLKLLVK